MPVFHLLSLMASVLQIAGAGRAPGNAEVSQSTLLQAKDSLPLWAFAYDRSASLDVQLTPRAGATGLTDFSFASPRGGRATGVLEVPKGEGRFPAVILLHGSGGNAANMIPRIQLLAGRGAVAVALDAPSARRPGQWIDLTPRDSTEQVQLIVDLQRTVDMLLARGDVDPSRIGFQGISYGAAMGALFAGVERRVRTYVLTVGDGGLVSHLTGPDDHPGPLGQLSATDRERWLAAMRPIEPIRFIHRAPPAMILFQSGRLDRLVPAADAERLHAAAREPKTVTWYNSDHGLPSEATDEMLAWLGKTIGLKSSAEH